MAIVFFEKIRGLRTTTVAFSPAPARAAESTRILPNNSMAAHETEKSSTAWVADIYEDEAILGNPQSSLRRAVLLGVEPSVVSSFALQRRSRRGCCALQNDMRL